MRKSYLTCKHKNIQQYTEYCLDCGFNIHMSEEKYLELLGQDANVSKFDSDYKIDLLEKRLGIKR